MFLKTMVEKKWTEESFAEFVMGMWCIVDIWVTKLSEGSWQHNVYSSIQLATNIYLALLLAFMEGMFVKASVMYLDLRLI